MAAIRNNLNLDQISADLTRCEKFLEKGDINSALRNIQMINFQITQAIKLEDKNGIIPHYRSQRAKSKTLTHFDIAKAKSKDKAKQLLKIAKSIKAKNILRKSIQIYKRKNEPKKDIRRSKSHRYPYRTLL